MSRCAGVRMAVACALLSSVLGAAGEGEATSNRKMLAQRPGIHTNDVDVAAVQRKADKEAAVQLDEAINKYSDVTHKSGWAKFMQQPESFKKAWNSRRQDSSGGPGSNKRKSGPLGYKTFVNKSQEAQRRWHALNQRALSKGHISKLPGQVDQSYKGIEYKKNEGKGLKIKKTDKNGEIRV
mmetsp:Transcript_36351/g.102687  ORF Transcript_36351/g.102687 Transcript_36351/m.102687 type:complete len:181 (+) Transcript_36351:147-689(+)|eukprot:CAMPEP_0117680424 /NCGR_PEP_ID=MMETSP0804-20121206/18346_1 /TAXON_ID=1074897 /ORGANISM="Tetraselmis astigmatica, Strain CCMP880" /LENGTH=180 /DNA_ID=CAMNT_0005489923 /DNA_START=141 /DNA_END=683 /DNA_ORIENTATION=+